jgi:hypothetical protein
MNATRRERSEHWIEYLLPRGSAGGELGKATAALLHELPAEKRQWDDAVTVDFDDEHIILRARRPESVRTIRVSYAEAMIESALKRLTMFRDGTLAALAPNEDAVGVAISALRQAIGDDEPTIDTVDG